MPIYLLNFSQEVAYLGLFVFHDTTNFLGVWRNNYTEGLSLEYPLLDNSNLTRTCEVCVVRGGDGEQRIDVTAARVVGGADGRRRRRYDGAVGMRLTEMRRRESRLHTVVGRRHRLTLPVVAVRLEVDRTADGTRPSIHDVHLGRRND